MEGGGGGYTYFQIKSKCSRTQFINAKRMNRELIGDTYKVNSTDGCCSEGEEKRIVDNVDVDTQGNFNGVLVESMITSFDIWREILMFI